MTVQISARWPEHFARGAGFLVMLLGVAVLGGWAAGSRVVTTVVSHGVAMVPATALGFVCCGGALLLASRAWSAGKPGRGSLLAVGCGILAAAMGLGHFVALAGGATAIIDGLGIFDVRHGDSAPEQMAGMTAANFILTGAYLLLASRRRFFAVCQGIAIVIGVAAWLGLTRYLFGGTPLLPFASMAIHTAPAFLLLAAGLLCLRPERGLIALLLSDSAGGLAARRLLPAVLIVPVVAGALRLQGQRAGWYGTEAGVSLSALANALLVGAVVWFTAAALHRIDLRRRRAESALRALALRLESVREQERTAVAREIHDVLAQELTCVKVDLVRLAQQPALTADRDATARIHQAMAQTEAAITTVQRIATGLRPAILDTLGLAAAIEWQTEDFGRRTGLACSAVVPRAGLLENREAATALFRIFQESLTNVARHAQATAVDVCLRMEDGNIVLTVRDDGRGITAAELEDPRSIGLVGMRERASGLDGSLQIAGSPEEGTTVIVRLPVKT